MPLPPASRLQPPRFLLSPKNKAPKPKANPLAASSNTRSNKKINIDKNQSALVPLLKAHIEAEKVTLWNPESAPLRGLWIKNTSGEVLDSGSFNILEADNFARVGSGKMEVQVDESF